MFVLLFQLAHAQYPPRRLMTKISIATIMMIDDHDDFEFWHVYKLVAKTGNNYQVNASNSSLFFFTCLRALINTCHNNNREVKIYNAAARRRAFKTKNVFIEDNNYE